MPWLLSELQVPTTLIFSGWSCGFVVTVTGGAVTVAVGFGAAVWLGWDAEAGGGEPHVASALPPPLLPQAASTMAAAAAAAAVLQKRFMLLFIPFLSLSSREAGIGSKTQLLYKILGSFSRVQAPT
jgi:hypothetical protein